jgi:hypothetical protein
MSAVPPIAEVPGTIYRCLHRELGKGEPGATVRGNMLGAREGQPSAPGAVLASAWNGRVMNQPMLSQVLALRARFARRPAADHRLSRALPVPSEERGDDQVSGVNVAPVLPLARAKHFDLILGRGPKSLNGGPHGEEPREARRLEPWMHGTDSLPSFETPPLAAPSG